MDDLNLSEDRPAPAYNDDPLDPKDATQQHNILKPKVEELKDETLNDAELREKYFPVLGDIKCCLIGLDGTLYEIKHDEIVPNPNAIASVQKLRESGLKVLFVVNTWLLSKENLRNALIKAGFETGEDELFTSSDCSKSFMKTHCCKHPFLLVADDVISDFAEFDTSDPLSLDSVIIGLPSTLIDYRLVTKLIMMLESGKPMIVLNPARSEKAGGATSVLGPGLFGSALEFATDSRQYVAGKPAAAFYTEACKYAGFATNECVMIGNDMDNDIRAAKGAGLKAMLCKTGKYKKKDENKYCNFKPDLVSEDFASAMQFLLISQSKEPVITEEEAFEVAKRAKLQQEREDFNKRLGAYEAAGDCSKDKERCAVKLPSYIW